jgi:putative membrane protein
LNPLHLEPTGLNIVFAGALAICAMILPGVSGSFILLLIGMYAPVLAAVKGFQIDILALFICGCVMGLLSFSHLLSWLLKRFREITLMFLVGLMVGTLPKIWPWKQTLTWRTNSGGEQVPLIQQNLWPSTFESITGTQSQVLLAIVMMLLAIGLVLSLEKFAEGK